MASAFESDTTVPHTGSMQDTTDSGDTLENEIDINGEQGGGATEPDQGVAPEGGEQQASEEQPPTDGTGDPGAYQFSPQNYQLKFRGKTITPESRDQLVNWAQLGYNYKQRETGLQKQQEELQQKSQQIESMQRLSDYFDQNPEFARQVQQLFHSYQNGTLGRGGAEGQGQQTDQQQVPPAAVKEIQALKQEIAELKGFQTDFQRQTAKQTVEKEINDLKSRYKDEQWDAESADTGKTFMKEVLELSAERDIPLEMAYRHLKWDSLQTSADAEARKREEQRRVEERKQGIVDSGGKPAPKQEPNLRGQGYNGVAKFLQKEDVNFFK